ncbi:DNA-binding protein WhiA [Mycoplasma sp. NEAQ87857]|uniref:DNA-binding protein WhiA n=1 Tax=Mycoplasma sp. NEAQ87857 TaxID=2683967 RepID=UPI001316670B|nr:DNA-binding protein WhiA [Mycoplasma sp. NEAQ87857]QGZ97699.1 DNA-binding protein WhiA [Mycoplasma sp. NEAQ87857]
MKQTNKSSFSWEVKKEVLNNLKNKDDIIAFINGLIYANAVEYPTFYELKIKNSFILEKILIRMEKSNIPFFTQKKWKTKFLIDKKDFKVKNEIVFKDRLTFFFAGVFCGSGNISVHDTTSYHLEISSHDYNKIMKIMDKLNYYEFNFMYLSRKNKHILYIKKLDKLLDFLSAIGAKKSWFKLQNLKIKRDFENVSNRINNIDFSNLQKIAKSSIKHNQNIDYVFEHNLLDLFNENQLVFLRIKSEKKWASLNEICLILEQEHNIFVSKSGLNHWLRKLNQIVENHKKEQN